MRIKVIDAVVKDTGQLTVNEGYIRSALRPGTELSFAHMKRGFRSIESDLHAAFNKPAIIAAAVQAERDGYDGVFINCFDDPGVYECRELLDIPVFGAYVPAMISALSVAERIAVITTDRFGILSEERKARMLGIQERLAAIVPAEMGVLELQADPDALAERIADICVSLYANHRAGAVCLGCTAMHCMIGTLRKKLKERSCPITVIEPLQNGICYLEHIIFMGYSNGLHVLNRNTELPEGY